MEPQPISFYKNRIFLILAPVLILTLALTAIYFFNPTLFKIFLPKWEKKISSCRIVEEQYCKEIKITKNPNVPDDPNAYIALFKLPKGTAVYAPTEGYYSFASSFSFTNQDNNKSSYPGFSATIPNGSPNDAYLYSLVFFAEKQEAGGNTKKIEAGEQLAKITDKSIEVFGDYNLIFGVTRRKIKDGKPAWSADKDRLEQILNIKIK